MGCGRPSRRRGAGASATSNLQRSALRIPAPHPALRATFPASRRRNPETEATHILCTVTVIQLFEELAADPLIAGRVDENVPDVLGKKGENLHGALDHIGERTVFTTGDRLDPRADLGGERGRERLFPRFGHGNTSFHSFHLTYIISHKVEERQPFCRAEAPLLQRSWGRWRKAPDGVWAAVAAPRRWRQRNVELTEVSASDSRTPSGASRHIPRFAEKESGNRGDAHFMHCHRNSAL